MANEIRILIVEDEHAQCALIAAELEQRIAACVFLRIPTESDFVARFAEIVSFSPHFAIVDLNLKWCEPEEASSRPQLAEMHHRRAGLRIFQCLSYDDATKSVPVLMVSALGRETIRSEFSSLPDSVYLPDRKSPTDIANAIASLIAASPSLSVPPKAVTVPQPQALVSFNESLASYLARLEGRRPAASPRPKLFISYCHEDRQLLEEIKCAIVQASLRDPIDMWEDTLLKSDEWKPQIDRHMRTARGALFLVTMTFCASSFIRDIELKYFLEAHRDRGTKIMWVAVGASSVQITPLTEFQCLNDPDRPLRELIKPKRDKVLVKIAEKIVAELRE
jgi:CheY-like chemotaxis protein